MNASTRVTVTVPVGYRRSFTSTTGVTSFTVENAMASSAPSKPVEIEGAFNDRQSPTGSLLEQHPAGDRVENPQFESRRFQHTLRGPSPPRRSGPPEPTLFAHQ